MEEEPKEESVEEPGKIAAIWTDTWSERGH
jgi:hypothetical protein